MHQMDRRAHRTAFRRVKHQSQFKTIKTQTQNYDNIIFLGIQKGLKIYFTIEKNDFTLCIWIFPSWCSHIIWPCEKREGHCYNHLNLVFVLIWPVCYRISLTLSCPMHLKLYPMDRQTCALKIASCECTALQYTISFLAIIDCKFTLYHKPRGILGVYFDVYFINQCLVKLPRELQ